MTAEVLRAGMHDQVRTKEEGVLQTWRGEGAIDDEECAARVGFFCEVCDVEGCAFRVDGCFEKDYIAGLEVFGLAVEVEFLEAGETGEEGDDAVAAVVAVAD